MTIWHSLTYNTKLNSSFRALKNWIEKYGIEAKSLLFFWNRIKETHPKSYLTFVVKGQNLHAFCFSDDKFVEQTTLSILDEDRPHLVKYLQRYPHHPLRVILQGGEADFRLVSLKNVRFWDRASLLKQVKLGEFTSSDWTQKLRIPSPEDPYRYLLMGIRPSHALRNLLSFLAKQSNPIANIQMWPIIAAEQTLKIAKETFPHSTIAKWSFIVLCQDNQQWQLIVCQDEAVVLSRQGFLNPLVSIDNDLSKEILATLRYLHRNGYQEGEPVTIIQCGFSEFINLESTIPTEILQLPEIIHPQNLSLSYFSLFSALKLLNFSFLPPLTSQDSSFELPPIRSHRLAFLLPQLAIHTCIPLLILLFLFGSFFLVKGIRQSQTYNFLSEEIAHHTLEVGKEKKLNSAKLFQFYKNQSRPNLIPKLQSLTANITPEAIATELKWQEINTPTLTYNLKMTLALDIRTSDTPAKKNGKKAPNPEAYQQKVERSITKICPSAHIEWPPSPQKTSLNLNVSYE
ncbi:MAG: hypothetical protein K2Q34_05815 [Alphaproteobacteria bacterium]|nr:hypothetical protein [Alphaproteobacteria bacterium]